MNDYWKKIKINIINIDKNKIIKNLFIKNKI